MSKIDVTDDPSEFAEAVAAFRRRVPMPDWKWDALSEAERTFAFKVSGVAQADLANDAWQAIDRAIAEGTTLDTFKNEVGAKLEAAWGKADPARLETIFRTNLLGAYNAGRHEILSHPEVKKARPFWRYDASGDDRDCDVCDALDGTVRPADDPWWHGHTPPCHFQCRCILVPLSQEEAEEEGIDKEGPDVDADEGFGKQPSGDEPGGDWEPDPSGYPKPIAEVLEGKLELAPEPPPPPPPPEPEPDHGPAFPKVAPELAPEALPSIPKPRWAKAEGGKDFVDKNEKTLRRLAASIGELTDGMGLGVDFHVASPDLESGRAAGTYSPSRKLVSLRPSIAKQIRDAVARGEIVTEREQDSVRILLHEQLHAASNPAYVYRGRHEVMEEATTELLAQHYRGDYIKRLGLKNRLGEDGRLFAHGDDGPVLGRMVAYPQYVQGYGRLVAYVDGVGPQHEMLTGKFDRHVAGRALQAKRAKGTEQEDQRYGMLVRSTLDKRGIKPTHAHYEAIRGNLADLFGDFVAAEGKMSNQRTADLDDWVGRIVSGGNYR